MMTNSPSFVADLYQIYVFAYDKYWLRFVRIKPLVQDTFYFFSFNTIVINKPLLIYGTRINGLQDTQQSF